MRLIPTKKGDLMAAVELEDLGGTVEVIVFPRTFQQHRDLLKEDMVLLVQGKVDTRDDQPKILCESVELFEPSAEQLMAGEDAPPPGFGEQTAYPLDAVEAEAAGLEVAALDVAFPEPSPESPSAGLAPPALSSSDVEPAARGEAGDAAETVEIPAGVAASWPDTAFEPELSPITPDGQMLLELTMERSAREERDVNRLVRLDHLLGSYPGQDRVVLRFLLGGREGPVLELSERVQCCAALVEQVVQELGEDAVRLRAAREEKTASVAAPVAPATAGMWPGGATPDATAVAAMPT
jgi:DNA polymerase-3 subunit alpha